MSANISERPKLLIVSDTAVYRAPEGRIVAFEPVIREIEHIAHLFESVTWIAYQYPLHSGVRNARSVSGVEIKYVLLPAVGGKGLFQRLRIIFTYLRLAFMVPYYISRADVIHTRGPSHPALVAIICSIINCKNKIFWHKYAGNWIRKDDPLSYKMNKYFLGKARRSKVTINGQWSDQPKHILSFENPCLTEQERIEGEKIRKAKNYEGKLDFVFVGQLTESKGVGIIIEAFRQLKDEPRIRMMHLVGDGPERLRFEKLAWEAGINCRFYGFLPREEVNKVLASSHVLLLPSESEGFPKVIAECANYGCVPVVSDISCIAQYVRNYINGFVMSSLDIMGLTTSIKQLMSLSSIEIKMLAKNSSKMSESFTYDHYYRRLKKEILDKDIFRSMSENISKRPDLLIVSDTAVFINEKGEYLAFEPVARELENFAPLFDSITWIASRYPYNRTIRNVKKIENIHLKYILTPAIGGKGFHNRIKIIAGYFQLGPLILINIFRSDIVHTRGPSHAAIIAAFYSRFFRKKIFWQKYAGNWGAKKDPVSYAVNKRLLKSCHNSKVTINGYWPGQPAHCLSFENPCLTNFERQSGAEVLQSKTYNGKLDLIFVGRVEEEKGVGRILTAFNELQGESKMGILRIVGDGLSRPKYEKMALELNVNAKFYGFLNREELNELFTLSHVLLLPSSASEGFPKVIAEGANYGCIPVVSDISSMPQYIQNNINGFVIPSLDAEGLKYCINNLMSINGSDLKQMALEAHEMGRKFTFDYYNSRIAMDILGLPE